MEKLNHVAVAQNQQPDPMIVAELRQLFALGATPSRLITHLCDRCGRTPEVVAQVQEYFRVAFGIPLLRLRKRGELLEWSHDDLRYAMLNHELVQAMVAASQHLDSTAEQPWYTGLPALEVKAIEQQVDPAQIPELATVWAQADISAQQYIRRLIANANVLYQETQLLATLAERLQQIVVRQETTEPTGLGDSV